MNLDIENVMEKNDPDELEYLKIGTRKYDEAEKANAEVEELKHVSNRCLQYEHPSNYCKTW